MVSYLTTLILGKPPRGSLPVFNAHYLPVTDNLLFLNQRKREIFSTKEYARVDLRTPRLQSGNATNRATMPGRVLCDQGPHCMHFCLHPFVVLFCGKSSLFVLRLTTTIFKDIKNLRKITVQIFEVCHVVSRFHFLNEHTACKQIFSYTVLYG